MDNKPFSFITEGRRSPRLSNQHATTHFGEVFDLSSGGMKVFRKSAEVLEIDSELAVDLKCDQHSVTVKVCVKRRECVGFHRHVYGLEFMDIDKAQQAKIDRLIEAACEPCATASCWVAA